MTESYPGAEPAGYDPTLDPLHAVIETLTGQQVLSETAGAVGSAAIGTAVPGESSGQPVTEEVAADDPEIKHERPKPEHWDELVEFASTLPIFKRVDKYGARYEDASVNALREKLESLLDNESLDQHRYYSIGMMLCGLAQGLQNPEQRIQAVGTISERLVAYWRLEGTGAVNGIMPADINGSSASAGLESMVTRFVAELPPHIRMLTDVLDWHALERRFAAGNEKSPADYAHLGMKGPKNDRHYYAGEGASLSGQVAAAAASRVLRDVLKRRAVYLAQHDPDFPVDANARQIIDRTDMGDINLIPVAQRAAAIRIDELRNLENVFLGLDEHGRAVFHGKKLPRSRDLGPPAADDLTRLAPLHTGRLRCPALFVEGLIPGVMDCLIDGVKAADAKLRQQREDAMRWQ
jgi:hypothetical protein